MNKITVTAGPATSSILTIVFVVLKLTGYIDWSWWWVLSPFLVVNGLGFLILIGIFIWVTYCEVGGARRWKKR